MSIFKESQSYRPFTYPWAVTAAQEHTIDMYWDVHQIELQDDLRQYNSKDGLATPNTPHKTNKNIINLLACVFTEMDRVVGAGYTELLDHVKNNEIRNLLITQTAREVTHQRAYALLAETFGFEDSDWTAFKEYEEMQEKLDVMSSNCGDLSNKLNWAKKLALVLLGEGVGLFAAFSILLSFKKYGLLIGFNDVNQWSLLDEEFHVKNNIRILKEVRQELTEAECTELRQFIDIVAKELCRAECKFIDLIFLDGEHDGATPSEYKDYIIYLRKFRLYQLGHISYEKIGENPLPWMQWLLEAAKHDNFFEKKVTDYVHKKLPGRINYSKYMKQETL